MKLRPFAVEEFAHVSDEGKVNLLANPTDHEVVAGVGNDRRPSGGSSEIDSLFCELNEVMDIDALISSGHNKCKVAQLGLYILILLVRGK